MRTASGRWSTLNSALAEKVIEVDEDRVNHLEIENEDAAINLMALYQPEASNLRTITMIIKINNDLERLGDHAVNIAEAAQYLIPRPAVKPLIDLPRMSEFAITMLKDALDSFTRADADLAYSVCGRDSVVDSLKDQITRELVTHMTSDATTIDRAMKLMMVALNLEAHRRPRDQHRRGRHLHRPRRSHQTRQGRVGDGVFHLRDRAQQP